MEIFQPDTAANPAYQDKKPRTKAAFDAFVTDHLAEGDPLKGGRITVPFLRSEPRPMKSHPHVVDLVGSSYDSYIAQKGRACLSFFYMPTCPHCGEHQLLQWSQVTWDKDEEGKHLPETARLVCSKCKVDISDKQRQQMVNQGEWRPTSEFTGKRGYHLNGLASLFPPRKGYKTRLHQAVSQFLDSKHRGTESLKAWTNTFLAETWEE